MSNPVAELPDGTLIDVRAVYKIEPMMISAERQYYNVRFYDGQSVGIYNDHFPRDKFVKIWKGCMDIPHEPVPRRKPARRIEIE